uniref:Uncharacterized protein n=1 Tax=Paramoeba aestuarina TaxID=180227 RepID=A0A7S4NT83_9EUKA|mmetsp:Transcript_25836/g.40311  ORF Transcript_25836/g.40311 Transcript_25836/m.40311 type:complete len:240 (+) Transcript_25836:453-1172(+)
MDPDLKDMHIFLDRTVDEVYNKLNVFIEELDFAANQDDLKTIFEDCEVSCPAREKSVLQRDLAYLSKMKNMDADLREKRLRGETTGERLKLTDVVPVVGLIMARFHIFECEAITALDMWKPQDAKERASSLALTLPEPPPRAGPISSRQPLGLSGCHDFMNFIAEQVPKEEKGEKGDREEEVERPSLDYNNTLLSPEQSAANSLAFFDDTSEPFMLGHFEEEMDVNEFLLPSRKERERG